MNKLTLHTAANSHLSIDFEEYDSPIWFKVVSILENDLGFDRDGDPVMGMDEGILPYFIKGEAKIAAGWDNWSGNYLLSESKEGDSVLEYIINAVNA